MRDSSADGDSVKLPALTNKSKSIESLSSNEHPYNQQHSSKNSSKSPDVRHGHTCRSGFRKNKLNDSVSSENQIDEVVMSRSRGKLVA